MDVATLVKAVISAFEEAASLVRRIKERKDGEQGEPLPEEPLRDLLDSLALGPVIVRGHYDHDLKRFGEPYACGDIQAREQMKDVLINLQMALMTHLRSVWMDDMELDFDTLQTASDDCRVNAGVCLGQLSQRLSDAAKAQAMYPHNLMPYSTGGMLMPPMSPSLHYSSSRSTASTSTFSRAVPPRTPDSTADHFATMSIASGSTARPTFYERKASGGSPGSKWGQFQREPPPPMPTLPHYMGQPFPQPRSLDGDGHSMRRPSSHTLAPEDSVLLLSPTTYTPEGNSPLELPIQQPPPLQQQLPGAQDLDRESYVSIGSQGQTQSQTSPHLSRTSSNHYSLAGGSDRAEERPGPPGRSETSEYNYQTVYDMRAQPQPFEIRPLNTSYSARSQAQAAAISNPDYSTLEHVTFLQQNARPPVPDMRGQLPRQYTQPFVDSPSAYNQPMAQNQQQFFQGQHGQQQQSMQTQLYPQPSIQSLNGSQVSNSGPPYQQANSQQQFRQIPLPTTNGGRPITAPGSPPQTANSADIAQPLRPDFARPNGPGPTPIEPARSIPSLPQSIQNQSLNAPPLQQTLSAPTVPMRTASASTTSTQPQPTPSFGPLIFPTDKNTQGFCKGAQRLQAGLEKKAFSVAARPAGFSGMIQYWKCEKCSFEGPLVTSVLPNQGKKGKVDKTFDNRIRVAEGGGVRYRWAFLAKSHVLCKTIVPDGPRDGSFGTFGCLFCCAEGGTRGWHSESARQVTGGQPGTPIFGNVQSFMEHLQMHRAREGWPSVEMLSRAKCVVGRVAEAGEDWDVNFVPV